MSPRDDKIAERKFSIGCPFKSPVQNDPSAPQNLVDKIGGAPE